MLRGQQLNSFPLRVFLKSAEMNYLVDPSSPCFKNKAMRTMSNVSYINSQANEILRFLHSTTHHMDLQDIVSIKYLKSLASVSAHGLTHSNVSSGVLFAV